MTTERSQAKRSVTAKDLLDEKREKLNELQTFLENDQSAVLAGLDQVQGETDRRTFFLLTKKRNASHRPTISDLFKRLLAIRYLASGYEMWLQDRGEVLMLRDSYEKPRNHGLCKIFMQEHGLPNTSQVRGWIENGQKVLRIERDVGVPGASLSLQASSSQPSKAPVNAHLHLRAVPMQHF